MKLFFIKVLVTALLVLAFVPLFNYFIDPLDIFNSPSVRYVNAKKPMIEENLRTWKTYKLDNKPEVIFLGTSRTHVGLDPSNKNFEGQKTFNCALYTGLPYEYEYFFDKALKSGNLKTVIIGLDFFAFYHKMLFQDDFKREDFTGNAKYKYLFSSSVFLKSISTVQKQSNISRFIPNGMGNSLAYQQDVYNLGGHGELFRIGARNYVTKAYSEKKELNMSQVAHLQAFERILDKAYKNNIKVILFISPSHARQWEALDVALGMDKWENWKKKIILINEKAASDNNKTPFLLWDFSGYSTFTMEEIPPVGDIKAKMGWYWDASHYKKELGDIMLDRIFGSNFANGDKYKDFGVVLNSQNFDEHISNMKKQREIWLKKHPAYVEEFEKLRKEVR
ncbi:MAG: hypothetical protein AB7D29_01980 [Campylobacterales bacterium]